MPRKRLGGRRVSRPSIFPGDFFEILSSARRFVKLGMKTRVLISLSSTVAEFLIEIYLPQPLQPRFILGD